MRGPERHEEGLVGFGCSASSVARPSDRMLLDV